MASERIRHEGVITRVETDSVHVRIRQSSACASCKVAAHCNAAETKEKVIEIRGKHGDQYKIGQQVTVSTTPRIGIMASVYAYAIPLVLMVGVIILVTALTGDITALTGDELTAACCGLAVLLPYYLLIYLLRDLISQQVYFEIETNNDN